MQISLYILSLLMANTATAYLLPKPDGKYNVTLTTGSLVDYTRNVSSNGTLIPRELMLSVFQPTTCTSTVYVPYMPNKTAEYQGPYLQQQFNLPIDLSPLFLNAKLPICPNPPSDCPQQLTSPILLLSPGWGIPRLYYSVLASSLASRGFTVITIDHPLDANIITYPDSRVLYGATPGIPTDETFTQLTYARAADASFLISQLQSTHTSHLFPSPVSTDKIAMLGHSLGGAAAVLAASLDPRIRAAINWDGSLFGKLPDSGLAAPVLYVSEANGADPSWADVWPRLMGPKMWIEVQGTTHQSFSDAGTLVEAAGEDLGQFTGLLGTIGGTRIVEILVAYAEAWVSGVFSGRFGGRLLDGKEGEWFGEVKVVRRGGF